ncbi:DUF5686 and carboxypeptidase-like regulatory domain-containing protein [Hymenobacter jejuensis]|uniref:Carboxypeptidase-like regulatory domain-containing protein n=1 Tax=Hymenobacter jejuensis TaxID=2502781 RepID=A0A5B8A269_9BACT|nr:DUF5686 and carboxypeptidase-like regulatory domain-containing protein [Hymenobacter jejuensis]QDA60292.1 carboxypeptidase-like regulatory domain-containing protein [Hymenobacter jejuensis]
MKNAALLLFWLLLLAGVAPATAQRILCSGQITEAGNGHPVPFASVFVPGTSNGTTADEQGRYQLTLPQPADTIAASALGFAPQKKHLTTDATQTINFTLRGGAVTLGEVTVRPHENPAYAIMRQVQAHKPQNNKRELQAFEFDSYNRVAVSISNLPAKISNRSVFKDMMAVADSKGQPLGPDGKPLLPIFASEVLSRLYVRHDPLRKREEIRRTQMRGVAPRDGSVLSQILGSSFQDWDFYPNWQQLLGKDFISPIADGWKFTYEYDLQDSVYVGKDWCYQLGVAPRRAGDLAFTGTIWITADSYALRRVDLTVAPKANLNFVDQVKVQQELVPSEAASQWLPKRTHVVIGLKPTKGSTGFLADFTTINSNFDVNHPKPLVFYALPVETMPDAYAPLTADYWEKNRPDSLSLDEQRTFAVLDSVRKLPSVHSTLELADIVVNGYKRVGNWDLGPVINTYSFNSIEGNRFRVGFRTTPEISADWLTRAYLAYGTRDGRFKYGVRVSRILNRRTWTVATVERRHDIDQVALLDNDYALENPLYEMSARMGNISNGRPLMRDLNTLTLQTDLFRGFTQKVSLRYQRFNPLYNFAYYNTDVRQPGAPTKDDYALTELVLESRYARDEVLIQNQNRRYAIGLMKWPVLTFRYTAGFDNVLGSDFKYHKFNLLVTQSVKIGQLGRTDYVLDGGYIPSTVPYPVLKTHLGNESPFYNGAAFNLMRYFEYVSDRYVSFRFENHFEGFLLNSVPAIKRLNWRLIASGNVLYGSVSDANRAINPPFDATGTPLPTFQSLGRTPYAEAGYGIENIFKVVRIDFLHRLTYRNVPGARNFGVKLSLQFKL